MPGPGDQHFFWMMTGTGRIGVESLDHQVKGCRSDHVEIPIDAGCASHFVGGSIKISETDICWHPDAASRQQPPYWKLVNQERIGFIAIKPIAKLCHIDILARNKRLTPILSWQTPLPNPGKRLTRDYWKFGYSVQAPPE
jgi:hypothetical protein